MASILINGSPTREFPISCGLKQGDPLAPLLFILVMESLHLSVSRAINDGFFTGLNLHDQLSISPLFYADDVIFLGEWSDANLANLIKILKCFHLASGLKINIHKSQLMGVGVSEEFVRIGASSIGCAVLSTPFKYLGVEVGGLMTRQSAWYSVIQKVHDRLSRWKSKTLSVGGRLTLLKSVLGATPLFTMSIYKVPLGVLRDLERIRSKFFIGANLSDRKISWVAWKQVLASKSHGGLGVSSFLALNRALLLKWVWRFISQDGSLWFHVIRAIHGTSIDKRRYFPASCWSSILREVHDLDEKGFKFISHCRIRVGDGSKTKFWLDPWLSEKALRDRFPRIFALESDKEVLVAQKMGDPSFCSSFRRQVRDGAEYQQWTEFISSLDSITLSSASDRWICDLNGDGSFRVKDIRLVLDNMFLPALTKATRWVKWVPIKVNVFVWRARCDRLPTRLNLSKRGMSVNSMLCPVCDSGTEDVHHLLFGCSLAKDLSGLICRWWNIHWTEPTSFSEWDSWFSSLRLSSSLKALLEGVFFTAWWLIWSYRNRIIFDVSPPKKSRIYDDVVSFSYTWCAYRCSRVISKEIWFKNPYLIPL